MYSCVRLALPKNSRGLQEWDRNTLKRIFFCYFHYHNRYLRNNFKLKFNDIKKNYLNTMYGIYGGINNSQ